MHLRLACPLAALIGALVLSSPEARACGGTFCDGGNPAMAVDQTGENVLFILDGAEVEAHIQIQYDPDTDASKFAWLIPMPTVPTFAVGSDLLFQALLGATVPTYGLSTDPASCPQSGSTDPGTDGGFILTPDAGGGSDGPVLVQTTVGAFDVVVLAGEDVAGLMQWLGDNGYQQDPEAAPILQAYLDEGNVLVAFKLTTGAGLASVHPVVLRYQGDEGCVPIRLTRIAAKEDMDIRVFALGEHRTVPVNYKHVLVNPLKIDWLNLGANYKEVISLAVDAFAAEGRAFVTEFAGGSEVVDPALFYSPQWDAAAFAGLAATEVVNTLQAQGLGGCFGDVCIWQHPLISGLLAQHLPPPDGLAPGEFYSCLSCFEAQIDLPTWDAGAGFSADFAERVVAPALNARDLLESWPYLTRMYTTISPNEMSADPEFMVNPDLPDVANLRTATSLVDCDAHQIVTLPDGRAVHLTQGDPWPNFQDAMPWEEDVDAMPPKGAPMPLVDNTPLIDKLLADWNAAHDGATTGDTESPDPTATSDGPPTGTGAPTSSAGTDSAGPTGDPESASDGATAGQGGDAGCGCRSSAPGWVWLAAPLLRRRRRVTA